MKDNDILFGKRAITGLDNSINVTYTFTNKANLTFRLRHYWQQVMYENFSLLQKDGTVKNIGYSGLDVNGVQAHDINANYFNIDCIFTWRFAPGSDMFITWKNAIYNEDQAFIQYNYFGNAARIFGTPQNNSLNVKVLYFLDYAETKKNLKK